MKKNNIILFTFVGIICALWAKIYFDAFTDGVFILSQTVKPTGELAFKLLIFMVFVSLAQKIVALHFPKTRFFTKLLPLRKWAGILAFLIAGAHGISEISKRGFTWENIIDASFTTHHAAVLGTISFLIMLPLFLTSTHWAIKKMGPKAWKNLQRLAHAAFVFAVLHVALLQYFGRGEIDFGPLVLLILYFGGYAYLFMYKKWK